MADSKISAMTAVTSINPADMFVLETVGGQSRKITRASMTAVSGFVGDDGWITDLATWTYVSATSFTVVGDRTAEFRKGTALRFTQSAAVKYLPCMGSSYSSPNTTVTTGPSTAYALTNVAISATSLSQLPAPQGYPTVFQYTPASTGWATPPASAGTYAVIGNVCWFWHAYISATSNSTSTAIALPVGAVIGSYGAIRYQNNTAHATSPGMYEFGGGTILTCYTNWGGGAWTASGQKAVGLQTSYWF